MLKFENPFSASMISYVIYAPNVLAVMLVIMAGDEAIKEVFATIVAPGYLTSYGLYMASNMGFYAISSASCVATVGSVMIIMLVIRRYWNNINKQGLERKIAFVLLTLFVLADSIMVVGYKMILASGGVTTSLNITINHGVAKGLKVSSRYNEMYENVHSDIEQIKSMPADTRVVFVGNTFPWMECEQRCGAQTTDIRLSPLKKYYEVYPDRIADVIYVQDGYFEEGEMWVNDLVESYGYSVTKVTAGWILLKQN
jgi:hypothetical protein